MSSLSMKPHGIRMGYMYHYLVVRIVEVLVVLIMTPRAGPARPCAHRQKKDYRRCYELQSPGISRFCSLTFAPARLVLNDQVVSKCFIEHPPRAWTLPTHYPDHQKLFMMMTVQQACRTLMATTYSSQRHSPIKDITSLYLSRISNNSPVAITQTALKS